MRGFPGGAFSVTILYGSEHRKECGEETAREIDNEIKGIVETTYGSVRQMPRDKKPLLEQVAQILLDKEVIDGEELRGLVRGYTGKGSRGDNDEPELRKEADRSY